MKKLLLAVTIGIFLPLACAFAVNVTSLYEAEISVPAQTEDLKAQAIKDGFLQILVKLSGDPAIAKNPGIIPYLSKADYYVQEFSYSATSTASSEYILHIRYDVADVNRLLKRAGVAYWGQTRPLLLVWLAVSKQGRATEIIGNETTGKVLRSMLDQGKQYGLPLIFPMMDVDDMSQVSPDDVTNLELPVLKEAAKRYAPDALLIGKMEQTAQGIQGEWALVLGNDEWKWSISEKTVNGAVGTLLSQVRQTLSKHYVEKALDVPQRWLNLEVMNITQRDDLTQLIRYLKQLSLVQKVQLSQVSSDVVDIAVLVRGSQDAFMKNASLDQRLVLKYQDSGANKLVYVWTH